MPRSIATTKTHHRYFGYCSNKAAGRVVSPFVMGVATCIQDAGGGGEGSGDSPLIASIDAV